MNKLYKVIQLNSSKLLWATIVVKNIENEMVFWVKVAESKVVMVNTQY